MRACGVHVATLRTPPTQGEAAALQRSAAGELVEVGRIRTGGYFGERALLTHEPRAATVRAAGALKVAAMARDAFERLLGELQTLMQRTIQRYPSAQDVLAGAKAFEHH